VRKPFRERPPSRFGTGLGSVRRRDCRRMWVVRMRRAARAECTAECSAESRDSISTAETLTICNHCGVELW
jgi:hypothetical protein